MGRVGEGRRRLSAYRVTEMTVTIWPNLAFIYIKYQIIIV
jgi:hypothetical protein